MRCSAYEGCQEDDGDSDRFFLEVRLSRAERSVTERSRARSAGANCRPHLCRRASAGSLLFA